MSSTALVSQPSSAAAHHVLTDPHFFRLLTPWVSGWPGLVLQKWHDYKSSHGRQQPPFDDYAFTKMLVERDDRRALELAVETVWRAPGDLDTRHRFRFRLDDAVAVGDATLVRRTFESNAWVRRNVTPWTWFTAVAYFRGDCAVLEVIQAYATPSWTESRIRSQLFRRDLSTRATELFQIADNACLQWIVDTFGPACLPPHLLGRLDHRLARLLAQKTRDPRRAGTQFHGVAASSSERLLAA